MAYQIWPDGLLKRMADGAIIPPDPANADYQRYLAWVSDGHTAKPAPLPPPPPRFIAKTTIYRRATDQELELLTATLPNLPLRQRLMWQDAAGGEVSVAEVLPFFEAAVGATRAAELLAP